MGGLPGSLERGSARAAASAPAVGTAGLDREERGRERRRRSHRGHPSQAGRWLADVGVGISAVLVVAAPLAVGGVHRPTLIALMAAAALCVGSLAVGQALQGRSIRVGAVILVPLVFTLIPLLQSIPLPLSLRGVLDGAGTALLRENGVAPSWPLSLDPPVTRVYVGRAAVALVVFFVAYHLASGQKRRHLLMRTVACAGLAAVAVGLGHRILNMPKLYGVIDSPGRALVMGPFVNANHTAELMELAVFVCLACSFQRETALNRIGWLVGTLVCAGAALATLSRGAVVAMAMGLTVFAFLRYIGSDEHGVGRRRVSLAWAALVGCIIVLGAAAFGAGQLVDRFRTDAVSTDVRFHLWRDSLRVFAAHPFGIGRGAFDRVFPIYRVFKMPFAIRFSFVENEPLQLLIDCGWFFCFLIAAAVLVLIGWRLVRHGRRDRIEAALVAGLFAVLAHSVLDFGLETLGVMVPFMAILGAVLGRLRASAEPSAWPARAGWAIAGVAGACALFGVAATAHRSNDDFDALLKQAQPPQARRALLTRAEQTHPLDYFYALGQARLLPLKTAPGGPSPRLHELNRALRLCPACEAAHVEVARNLWRIGLRPQALLEWRTAVEIQPLLFTSTLGELFVAGARPEELAAVASTDVGRTLELVAFLSAQERVKDALVVLSQAEALGAAPGEILLARGGLELKTGQLDAAAATVDTVMKLGVQDPRLAVLRARLILARQGVNGADQALALLDEAAIRDPANLTVQRERVEMVVANKKWNASARSLEGLKLALFHNYGSATEAHIWAARINVQLGRWNRALDEFRIALADRSTDVSLWIEYAHAAETGGRDVTAREAYGQASRLSPNSPDIASAQHALEARSLRMRAPQQPAGSAP